MAKDQKPRRWEFSNRSSYKQARKKMDAAMATETMAQGTSDTAAQGANMRLASVGCMTDEEIINWLKDSNSRDHVVWRTFPEAVAFALVRSKRPITVEMIQAMSPELKLKIATAICLRKAKQ